MLTLNRLCCEVKISCKKKKYLYLPQIFRNITENPDVDGGKTENLPCVIRPCVGWIQSSLWNWNVKP